MKCPYCWMLLVLAALGGGLFWTRHHVPAQDKDQKKASVVEIDGLQSRTPDSWVEEEPPAASRQMRYKQFRLPPINDDKDPAQMIIFFFGKGGGGGVEANLTRWKGMFVPPEGKKIDDVAKVDTFKVGDVPVTYLNVHGTYLFKSRPFAPDSETARRPNYRMLGVVFESKDGPYFIRLVGPAVTVEHYKKGFDEWLKGFK